MNCGHKHLKLPVGHWNHNELIVNCTKFIRIILKKNRTVRNALAHIFGRRGNDHVENDSKSCSLKIE